MIPASEIKNMRLKLGISQKEAAAKIGIPRRTYSDYERGTSIPKCENYNKLKNWLNADTADCDLNSNDIGNIVQELHFELKKVLLRQRQENLLFCWLISVLLILNLLFIIIS